MATRKAVVFACALFTLPAVDTLADGPKALGRFEAAGDKAFSLVLGETADSGRIRTRALDPQLRPAAGVPVVFVVPSSCGTFNNLTRILVLTDANGIANPGAFASGGLAGVCVVRAEAVNERLLVDFSVHIFDPADVTVTITPTELLTPINSVFPITAELRGAAGALLPLAPIEFSIRPDGLAGASLDRYSGIASSSDGTVTVNAITNDRVGFFKIVASFAGAEASLGVQHRITGSNNPGPARSIAAPTPTGSGNFVAVLDPSTLTCGFADNRLLALGSAEVPAPPLDLRFPHGIATFTTQRCGAGREVRVSFLLPQVVSPGAAFWRYGPTPENPAPHWYVFPVSIVGNVATLTIRDGGAGDEDGLANDSVKVFGGIASTDTVAPLQDLWWVGLPENGWGASVFQSGGRIWLSFFVYGPDGKPTWYVSNGSLDASGRRYSGTLTAATGAPFYAYDAARFQPRNAGSVSIEFADNEHATLDFTITGVSSGRKSIIRQGFGPPALRAKTAATGLYWGGPSENGWGLSIHEQYGSLFVVWFTYDVNGNPVWFVAPAGTFNASGAWTGLAYRTVGSPWAAYDRTKFDIVEVGSFQLRPTGDDTMVFEYVIEGRAGAESILRQPY